MTKEELEEFKSQMREELKKWDNTPLPSHWTWKDFSDTVKAAYNKAIDDALELYYNPSEDGDQDTFDKDLEQLKIK